VRGVLQAGAHDGRAVAVLAHRGARVKVPALSGLPERPQGLGSRAPSLESYDELLTTMSRGQQEFSLAARYSQC
jgi:hypothetical protein